MLEKFNYYRNGAKQFEGLKHKPYQTIIEKVLNPCEVIVQGQRTIMLGSNNYLGLTTEPELKDLAQQAIADYGVGTTGARPMNGNYAIHKALEDEVANFMGTKYAMVFTTGHQTNLGIIPTLAGKGDFILIDGDCHASIYDACQLSLGDTLRFQHNDISNLKRKLGHLNPEIKNKLIIVESCYSVLGDIAPLEKIVELKKEFNAYLLVDEAHSFGIFGDNGRGLSEALGVESEVDFTMGTFSKALAGVGGFCASNHDAIKYMHYCARSYMFTASASPSNVASVIGALKLIRKRPELRKRLWENCRYMHKKLRQLGFRVIDTDSPIISMIIGEQEQTILFWEALLEAGVYVNVYVPPTTPKDCCVLRTSYSPAFNQELLDEALDIFEKTGHQFGLIE